MKKSPLAIHDAHIWMNCTGSVSISEKYPAIESGEGVSEARLEGRAFHEVSRSLLEFHKCNEQIVKTDFVGTLSNDNILITDEIFEAAVDYTDDVYIYCKKHDILNDLHIEEYIDTNHLSPDTYGYIDSWVFNPKTMMLAIWEGKYGHRFVDVFQHWQLLIYLSGILEELKIADQKINVQFRIAQPRNFNGNGPIREWLTVASDLKAYFNMVTAKADNARSGGSCNVGMWCHDCTGRYACKTLQNANYQGIDYQRNAEGILLTGVDLSLELKILNKAEIALKARKSGLEEQALAEFKKGKPLPFFNVEQGYGNKRWKKDTPHAEVIAMGDMMDIDLRKPVQLDTPTQALKKGIDESVIKEYSETPKTKLKLVEDNGAIHRERFSKIKGT